MTVRLYQDVDGCLNAMLSGHVWGEVGETGDCGALKGVAEAYYGEDGQLDPNGRPARFNMWWNSRLIDALNEMDVEFVWTTTWREDARNVAKLMKLTHQNSRVLHPLDGKTRFPSIGWKFDALVAEQMRDPSPFIWVDDEIQALPRAAREMIHQLGGLMICPDSGYGMTPKHVKMMSEYFDNH